MSIHTLAQLYGELKSRTKTAADITSEDIVGQDPGSMPGSENDKKVPEEMKTPDPEVKDETVGGAENYSSEGASPGSDNPKLEPQLLEADEPVLTPEKKPLDSTDVDAKTAAAGNNLVDFILKAQERELAAKKAESSKQTAPDKATPEKQAAPAKDTKAAPEKQAAPTDDIVLTNSVMAKIAAVVLSRQEGRELVQRFLAEAAGEDFAKQAMDTMGLVGRQANELSEFEKGAQDAEAMLGDMEEAQGAQDAEQAIADAGAAEQAAGDAGAEMDAGAALEGAGEEGAEGGDEGFTDEEVLEAIQEMVENGEITEDQAAQLLEGAGVSEDEAGDEEVTEDDIAEALVEGIQSGEISPEVAQEIVSELSGETSPDEAQELATDVGEAEPAAEGAAAAEGEAPAADEPAADEPAAEEPAPEEAKEASVKRAAAHAIVKTLVKAIQEKQAAAKKARKAPVPAKKPVKK